nr:hypothetical protein [Methanosarcina horonobensis]
MCPGTTFCKRGKQDSVGLGLKLDKKIPRHAASFQIQNGCFRLPNSCSETSIKDIGIMGTAKGFNLTVGGSAGPSPRLGDLVAKDLSEEQVLDLVEKIIDFYKGYGKPKRLGKVIDEIGIEKFKEGIGL